MECAEPQNDAAVVFPDAEGELSPEVAAVRAALLSGLASKSRFAAAIGKCERTVNMWIADGMPTVRVGRTPYIPIMEARAWLLKSSSRQPEARKPGRPRRAA
jgi:hypothetical protein